MKKLKVSYLLLIVFLSLLGSCIRYVKDPFYFSANIKVGFTGGIFREYFDTLYYDADVPDRYKDDISFRLFLEKEQSDTLLETDIDKGYFLMEPEPNKAYVFRFEVTYDGEVYIERDTIRTGNYPYNPQPTDGAVVSNVELLKWDCADFPNGGNEYWVTIIDVNNSDTIIKYSKYNFLGVDDLTPGKYFWRVTVIPNDIAANNETAIGKEWSFIISSEK